MTPSARQRRQCPEGCGKGLLRKTVHLAADATLVGCTALPAEEEIERLEGENAELRAQVEQLTRERDGALKDRDDQVRRKREQRKMLDAAIAAQKGTR